MINDSIASQPFRSRPLEDASFYSEVEREPRRHHRHCRSRHRVYPDDPRQGFRERYVGPQYGMDFHHVYDRLPADFESVGYPVERETTIRWADDNGRRDYERRLDDKLCLVLFYKNPPL